MNQVRTKRSYVKHGASRTPEYVAWESMRQRCLNSNNRAYRYYGARGITIDERWNLFTNFLEDMGPKPHPSLSLERRDNNKGYSKENCYFATRSEQNRNRRRWTWSPTCPSRLAKLA